MSRGSKIALSKPSRRDVDGHSLPSDRSMQFVAVDLLCICHPDEPGSTLARLAIDSWHAQFLPNQVYERGDNKAIAERQPDVSEDGSIGVRYVFECPRRGCKNRPVFRSETLDKILAYFYKRGARDLVIPFAI